MSSTTKPNRIAALLFITMLCSCSTPPQKITETKSGWPEIQINGSMSDVAENIITRNATGTLQFRSQSANSIRFFMPDTTGSLGSAAAMVAVGGPGSSAGAEVDYLITGGEESTRVIVNANYITTNVSGQRSTISLKNNNEIFNTFQSQLIKIKKEVEPQ